MITESARVVAVSGDRVTVEAAIKTTCSSCQAQSDCGSGVISRALAPKVQQLTVSTPVPVKVGDMVQIGLPEAGLVSASAWLYLVPLMIFLFSAMILNSWLPTLGLSSELWVLLGSALVTLAGFVLISGHLKKLDKSRFQPVLLNTSVSNAASDLTR
ncbi:transcriptional regulator [Alteromonas aestuariivivens]|uniref:Transcriptional regulator n=1 Tax=Alteromonas aestuariivivens TaxID=1938339 RepID=A0A3D8MEV3_9ALTE|nr:SoxR reducing system RseC family protein [Alteromonas aestuariivivens]RDV29337.1 transcriptional regulator [Alteromonas aestuariivivens]